MSQPLGWIWVLWIPNHVGHTFLIHLGGIYIPHSGSFSLVIGTKHGLSKLARHAAKAYYKALIRYKYYILLDIDFLKEYPSEKSSHLVHSISGRCDQQTPLTRGTEYSHHHINCLITTNSQKYLLFPHPPVLCYFLLQVKVVGGGVTMHVTFQWDAWSIWAFISI